MSRNQKFGKLHYNKNCTKKRQELLEDNHICSSLVLEKFGLLLDYSQKSHSNQADMNYRKLVV
jgi:hypothetical protein